MKQNIRSFLRKANIRQIPCAHTDLKIFPLQLKIHNYSILWNELFKELNSVFFTNLELHSSSNELYWILVTGTIIFIRYIFFPTIILFSVFPAQYVLFPISLHFYEWNLIINSQYEYIWFNHCYNQTTENKTLYAKWIIKNVEQIY